MNRKILLIISLFAVISCSTTKLLPEGTYRLASQKVEVEQRGDAIATGTHLLQVLADVQPCIRK